MTTDKEKAIQQLKDDFTSILNTSHVLDSLLCNTLYAIQPAHLEALLEDKREVNICISDSSVIDFLENAAEEDRDWLDDCLYDISGDKPLLLTVYQVSIDDGPNLGPYALSINLVEDDDFVEIEDIEEVVLLEPAIAEPPKTMAAAA